MLLILLLGLLIKRKSLIALRRILLLRWCNFLKSICRENTRASFGWTISKLDNRISNTLSQITQPSLVLLIESCSFHGISIIRMRWATWFRVLILLYIYSSPWVFIVTNKMAGSSSPSYLEDHVFRALNLTISVILSEVLHLGR